MKLGADITVLTLTVVKVFSTRSKITCCFSDMVRIGTPSAKVLGTEKSPEGVL